MKSPSNNVRRAQPLLGTIVEITANGPDERWCHAAIDAAFATVAEVQRRMSFHDAESTLSRLNRSASQETVQVDEWTYAVLEFAGEMYRPVKGLFDVSVAPLLEARGFLHQVSGALPGVGSYGDVQLLPDRRVRFGRHGLRLDLGGIAKGFAVDQAVATLQTAGIRSGLVNAGGDLRAFGGETFPVVIRNPHQPGLALATIPLREASLATSGHYFADRMVPDAEFGPIFHPHSGEPARTVSSATVRAATAMAADALTKVVMLADEAALPMLEHFGADAIFVAQDGRAVCSPGFHAAFEFPS